MSESAPTVPPLDPDLAEALGLQSAIPRMNDITLSSIRHEDVKREANGHLDIASGEVDSCWLTVPRAAGTPELPLLVLRPTAGSGPWPLIYAIHGGGMVSGHAEDEVPRYLPYVEEGLAVVVSVEYRLAPEHPDPAPIEDCYSGLVWVAEHADEISVDPARILIAGVSAGGGLAAGTALLARDRVFPSLTHQVLSCPMLDDRAETVSSRMLDRQGIWDRSENQFGWDALLSSRRGGPNVSAYTAPARATNLAGLPTTFLDVGGVETFRDEVMLYALHLSEAGVSVEFHLWAGAFHCFDSSVPSVPVSQESLRCRDEFIRRALVSEGPGTPGAALT